MRVVMFVMFTVLASGCSTPPVKDIQETLQRVKTMLNTPKIPGKVDPTAPEKGTLKEKVKEMEHHLTDMEEGKTKIDVDLLGNISKKLEMIVLNYQQGLSEVIHEDVSFTSGKYSVGDITANGQQLLNKFSQRVTDELVKSFKQTFPEDKLKVFIRVVGYADSVPPHGQLEVSLKPRECLSSSRNSKVPSGEEGSSLLNRELSCLRAKSIEEYLRKHVESNFPRNDPKLELADISNEGRGEESPYTFTDSKEEPYHKEDPRRRICKIYANVFVE